jgi:hypothetical protein
LLGPTLLLRQNRGTAVADRTGLTSYEQPALRPRAFLAGGLEMHAAEYLEVQPASSALPLAQDGEKPAA